jgi:hypothetical protein
MQKWSPEQWDGGEGDIDPELPYWESVVDMILENFSPNLKQNPVTINLEGRGTLTSDRFSRTVLTLSYCCLRSLTVRETWQYFGKAGEAYLVCGESHPSRSVWDLVRTGKGDDMISNYVSFPQNTNPLEVRAYA